MTEKYPYFQALAKALKAEQVTLEPQDQYLRGVPLYKFKKDDMYVGVYVEGWSITSGIHLTELDLKMLEALIPKPTLIDPHSLLQSLL